MSTRLGISTVGLSTVSNDIRAVVFAASDLSAAIQSIVETGSVHNDRQWIFYGLQDNTNFVFKMQKDSGGTWIDISGYTFTFTSGDSNISFRPPIVIQVDTFAGLVGNTNTATFDGTTVGGVTKDDWRGWDIEIERIGIGTMKPSIDYNFNKITGYFTLLVTGDIFGPGEYFNVRFILKTQTPGGSVDIGKIFSSNKVITTDYSISINDFGTKIIAEATGSYLQLTLPDISTVPENKMLFIETGIGNHINVGINTLSNSQHIKFLTTNKTSIYLGKCENISIYKQIQADTTQVWRINDNDSNIKTVGSDFHSYTGSSDIMNAILLDGGGTNGISSTNYARLYEYVLSLDPSMVCNYSDWSTGSNKYKYSYKDATTGLFHVPDTRDMFIRNTGSRVSGLYQADSVGTHDHIMHGKGKISGGAYSGFLARIGALTWYTGGGRPDIFGNNGSNTPDSTLRTGDNASNQENRPVNVSFNHFIYI